MIKLAIFFAVGYAIGFIVHTWTSRQTVSIALGVIFLLVGIIIGGIE
jgi:hypothetical protein